MSEKAVYETPNAFEAGGFQELTTGTYWIFLDQPPGSASQLLVI